jgi:hypothetical protein
MLSNSIIVFRRNISIWRPSNRLFFIQFPPRAMFTFVETCFDLLSCVYINIGGEITFYQITVFPCVKIIQKRFTKIRLLFNSSITKLLNLSVENLSTIKY